MVFAGSNVVPSIGSVPLGTTFHVVATAPIQYSTVRPVLMSAAGLKVACFALGFFAVTAFGDAAPDGSTNASSAPAANRITAAIDRLRARPRSGLTGTDKPCFTTPTSESRVLRTTIATGFEGDPVRRESSGECSASV